MAPLCFVFVCGVGFPQQISHRDVNVYVNAYFVTIYSLDTQIHNEDSIMIPKAKTPE